jgi:5-oxoprolinase (ATP-hydrolysing)
MESTPAGSLLIGFDIGGTFTDFVLLDPRTQALSVHKALTTPHDPAAGAIAGLDALMHQTGARWEEVGTVVHGTTIVTNAIIERKGVPTALLATRGFRDVIETGAEQRYDIHDIFLKFPAPLVPRALRFEITERIAHDGAVMTAIDPDEVRRALADAVGAGARAAAVAFLHAYRNDAHEQIVAGIAAREFPGLHVSLSGEVCGEIREYERTTTTTANAYVQPLVEPYLRRIEQALADRGFAGRFALMQSSGGLASPEMARRFPVRLLESGPAGGAIAAGWFGATAGHEDVIAFDMGGTTAKVCLIQDGQAEVAPMMEAAREHRFKRGSGLPIRAPVIDMIEIGAGGGSIAHLDELGLLKVGPQSSGASPGPACYGLGGTAPTVTDANLLLGYLAPDSFLGGRLRLDPAAAQAALETLGAQIGSTAVAAAAGVFAVVCEAMAGAARVHIVEKGHDPRAYALIAFGGAGPAHAVRVARALGVGKVIVPPASGAASALGFLGGRLSHEAARSAPSLLARIDGPHTDAILGELESDGRLLLDRAGVAQQTIEVRRDVDMRLAGQVHNLRIAVPDGALDSAATALLTERFADKYRQLYGRPPSGGEIEVISWRVTCMGPAPDLALASIARPSGPDARPALKGQRPVWFPESSGFVETPVYDRYALRPGDHLAGPAIIEEDEATTVIPPGDDVTVDARGSLLIAVQPVVPPSALETAAAAPGSAVARLEADPIGLEIMWSRLITISEECWLTVIRTAFSLIIGEAQDFGCEILDAAGQSLAHSPRAMPVFNITLMAAVNSLLQEYPPETLAPGDVLITNDPWLCAGHLFDIAVVTPVFREGRLVALIGAIGHVSDIGGTRERLRARETYDEGLLIPPMKLHAAGVANDSLLRVISGNVRNAAQVLGDIQALISANTVGVQRLVAFMDEYGLQDLTALATVIQGRAERAMRDAIRAVPDGVYRNEVGVTVFGERLRFPVEVTIDGDQVAVDYQGSPAQLPVGGLNCTMRFTEAETLFPMKCLLTPAIRASAGCYRAFSISAPEGSIWNCTKPASVGLRHLTGWYLVGNIFKAMSEAMPDRVQAFSGLPCFIAFYGQDGTGRVHSDHLVLGGGQGGSPHADGKSGMLWPTSAAAGSVEIFETRSPVLVLEKLLVTDSGGAGQHRGGLGQSVQVRRLREDGGQMLVNVNPGGVDLTTEGLFGGQPGGAVRASLRDVLGREVKHYGEGALETLRREDEIIEICVGGGAGYGDPRLRPVAAVQADLDGGYISAAAAQTHYGCVIGEDGRIDAEATRAHRAMPVSIG